MMSRETKVGAKSAQLPMDGSASEGHLAGSGNRAAFAIRRHGMLTKTVTALTASSAATRRSLLAAAVTALLALSGTAVAQVRPDGAMQNIVIVHGASSMVQVGLRFMASSNRMVTASRSSRIL
jgi:hypothetical protein